MQKDADRPVDVARQGVQRERHDRAQHEQSARSARRRHFEGF
jgi:hypothetical protein